MRVFEFGVQGEFLWRQQPPPAEIQKALAGLRAKLRPILKPAATQVTPRALSQDAEASRDLRIAQAKRDEIAARRAAAEAEGDARALAAANRDLVAADAVLSEAQAIADAAAQIARRAREEAAKAADEANQPKWLAVLKVLDEEQTAAEDAVSPVLSPLAARLAAVSMLKNAASIGRLDLFESALGSDGI